MVKNWLVSHTQGEDWPGIGLGLCYACAKVAFTFTSESLFFVQWKYLSCLFLMSSKHSCVLIPPPTTLQLTSNLKCDKLEEISKLVSQLSVTDGSGLIQHSCKSPPCSAVTVGLGAKDLVCSLKICH